MNGDKESLDGGKNSKSKYPRGNVYKIIMVKNALQQIAI